MKTLKEYRYSPEEVGRDKWPDGELRLAGTVIVTDPKEADVFVCPAPLFFFKNNSNELDPDLFKKFEHFAGNERRHVFFDVSDYATVYPGCQAIMLRCNLKQSMLQAETNSMVWPWPVENFAECIDLPAEGFKFDVSFQGWLSTKTRELSAEACRKNATLRSDIATYSDFCGYIYDTPEGLRRRREFRRSMRESRVALCAESIRGVLPYRFYEALSAGRVPMLVGSDYVLPFADEIPYDEFIIRCARDGAAQVDVLIQHFVSNNTDSVIAHMGRKGRYYWERYLDRDLWATTMRYAVDKKLFEFGLLDERSAL